MLKAFVTKTHAEWLTIA